jgi:hypothetical protein
MTQPPPQPTYVEPAPVAVEVEDEEEWSFASIGFGLTIGGGVSGFTDDTFRDTTDDGGNWDVRATIGTRSFIAGEASYLGSAQSIDALGLDDDAVLLGNGLQGNVRVNFTTAALQPFVYGGVAWRRYEITNDDFNTSDVADDDDVLEIPGGVGLAYKVGGFMLDARAEYRYAFYEDMLPSAIEDFEEPGDAASMHRYSINANVGVEF